MKSITRKGVAAFAIVALLISTAPAAIYAVDDTSDFDLINEENWEEVLDTTEESTIDEEEIDGLVEDEILEDIFVEEEDFVEEEESWEEEYLLDEYETDEELTDEELDESWDEEDWDEEILEDETWDEEDWDEEILEDETWDEEDWDEEIVEDETWDEEDWDEEILVDESAPIEALDSMVVDKTIIAPYTLLADNNLAKVDTDVAEEQTPDGIGVDTGDKANILLFVGVFLAAAAAAIALVIRGEEKR